VIWDAEMYHLRPEPPWYEGTPAIHYMANDVLISENNVARLAWRARQSIASICPRLSLGGSGFAKKGPSRFYDGWLRGMTQDEHLFYEFTQATYARPWGADLERDLRDRTAAFAPGCRFVLGANVQRLVDDPERVEAILGGGKNVHGASWVYGLPDIYWASTLTMEMELAIARGAIALR